MTNPTERPEERESLAGIEERLADGYIARSQGGVAVTHRFDVAVLDLRALINEVKELREERNQLAPLIAETHDALPALKAKLARAEQMEEALREADKALAGMWSFSEEGRSKMAAESPHIYYVKASEIIRAALSPSDTEEVIPDRDRPESGSDDDGGAYP